MSASAILQRWTIDGGTFPFQWLHLGKSSTSSGAAVAPFPIWFAMEPGK